MAIKVDLEKAYDRMSWQFMEKVLREVRCPEAMLYRIMKCITTTSTKILWHGEMLDEFDPSRGLRQGDPISPYLFVLGMEKITHLISDRVREKKWKGMRAGRKGPIISHMMFADDLVLFAEAEINQIEVILKCLQEFGEMSGHKVSKEKTQIYFSANVKQQVRREICRKSQFRQVEDIGRYLGAEISFPRRRKERFRRTIEKVKKRLSGWKAASLSLAGRITLVKSVTNALPVFTMQHERIPKIVIEVIEKDQRRFIWGEQEGRKKWHAIAWDTLCKSKEAGGVGIKSLEWMNDALLLKLLWRMKTEPNALWVQVLLGKYKRPNEGRGAIVAKNADSKLWKELVKLWDKFYENAELEMNDGLRAKFWTDKWLGYEDHLIDFVQNNANVNEQLNVCELVDEEGKWNLTQVEEHLPETVVRRIEASKLLQKEKGPDRWKWRPNNNGDFSTASTYKWMQSKEQERGQEFGK